MSKIAPKYGTYTHSNGRTYRRIEPKKVICSRCGWKSKRRKWLLSMCPRCGGMGTVFLVDKISEKS